MTKEELIFLLEDIPDNAEIFVECDHVQIPTKMNCYDVSDTPKKVFKNINFDFEDEIDWIALDKNATAVLLS